MDVTQTSATIFLHTPYLCIIGGSALDTVILNNNEWMNGRHYQQADSSHIMSDIVNSLLVRPKECINEITHLGQTDLRLEAVQ